MNKNCLKLTTRVLMLLARPNVNRPSLVVASQLRRLHSVFVNNPLDLSTTHEAVVATICVDDLCWRWPSSSACMDGSRHPRIAEIATRAPRLTLGVCPLGRSKPHQREDARLVPVGACACACLARSRALRHPVSYTHLRAHETPEHLVCR